MLGEIPGAVVVLVQTPTSGELRLFRNGDVNLSPQIVSFSGLPLATPRAMKVLSIDGAQHAWVALTAGGKNVVALFNLATGARVGAFDIELNALEPLALTVGAIDGDDDDEDTILGTTTAFLHVLVKAN